MTYVRAILHCIFHFVYSQLIPNGCKYLAAATIHPFKGIHAHNRWFTVSTDSSSTTTVSTATQSMIINRTRTDRSDPKPNHHHGIRVEFPGKEAGVSYLEQLMMRRHRVDPKFLAQLSKAKRAGIRSCNIDREGLEDSDQRVAGDEDHSELKSEPSQYNIFYSEGLEEGNVEMVAEISGFSSHDELESFERPLSSVMIEEMHRAGAVPSASTYTCSNNASDNANNLMERFAIESKVSAPSAPAQGTCKNRKDQSSRKTDNKPISAKGSKLKTNKGPSSKKSVVNVDLSQEAAEHSVFIESAVAASVKNAWANSTQAGVTHNPSGQLTEFFLSGVQKSAQEAVEGKSVEDEVSNNSQLQFASTIWLPGNSIADPSDIESGITGDAGAFTFDGNGAGSNDDTRTTNFATEPPPPSVACYQPPQQEVRNSSDISTPTPSYYDSIASSDCESEDQEDLVEFESEGRKEQQEWEEWEEQEDSETLENLAWELASVTGGRLTRCEREEEEVEEEEGGMDYAGSGVEGQVEEVGCLGSDVELQQVMSDFELYQQQIMEESD